MATLKFGGRGGKPERRVRPADLPIDRGTQFCGTCEIISVYCLDLMFESCAFVYFAYDHFGGGPFKQKTTSAEERFGRGPFRQSAASTEDRFGRGLFRQRTASGEDRFGRGPLRQRTASAGNSQGAAMEQPGRPRSSQGAARSSQGTPRARNQQPVAKVAIRYLPDIYPISIR